MKLPKMIEQNFERHFLGATHAQGYADSRAVLGLTNHLELAVTTAARDRLLEADATADMAMKIIRQ